MSNIEEKSVFELEVIIKGLENFPDLIFGTPFGNEDALDGGAQIDMFETSFQTCSPWIFAISDGVPVIFPILFECLTGRENEYAIVRCPFSK